MKCAVLYHNSVLCIAHYICFVKNDEIEISTQSYYDSNKFDDI